MTSQGVNTNGVSVPRGCAGLALSEVLLRIGDVGAARNQLELVADEPEMPPGVAIIAHFLAWAWRPWLPGSQGYTSSMLDTVTTMISYYA